LKFDIDNYIVMTDQSNMNPSLLLIIGKGMCSYMSLEHVWPSFKSENPCRIGSWHGKMNGLDIWM